MSFRRRTYTDRKRRRHLASVVTSATVYECLLNLLWLLAMYYSRTDATRAGPAGATRPVCS
jgi:hypothetical protein